MAGDDDDATTTGTEVDAAGVVSAAIRNGGSVENVGDGFKAARFA
jgi:hypothetical protein